MKVAKCCESKEPEQFELLSWEQMQAKEGIYVLAADYGKSPDRFIVFFGAGAPVLLVYSDQCLFHPGHLWETGNSFAPPKPSVLV